MDELAGFSWIIGHVQLHHFNDGGGKGTDLADEVDREEIIYAANLRDVNRKYDEGSIGSDVPPSQAAGPACQYRTLTWRLGRSSLGKE